MGGPSGAPVEPWEPVQRYAGLTGGEVSLYRVSLLLLVTACGSVSAETFYERETQALCDKAIHCGSEDLETLYCRQADEPEDRVCADFDKATARDCLGTIRTEPCAYLEDLRGYQECRMACAGGL